MYSAPMMQNTETQTTEVETMTHPTDAMNASTSGAYAVVQISKYKFSVIRQRYQAGNGRNEPIQVFGVTGRDFRSEDEALAHARKMNGNV